MLSHNKQIGYTCKVCKMNVRSREALKRHENLHTKKPGDKYECRYCLSYFPNIGAKVAHERASHSGAKDLFKCSVNCVLEDKDLIPRVFPSIHPAICEYKKPIVRTNNSTSIMLTMGLLSS